MGCCALRAAEYSSCAALSIAAFSRSARCVAAAAYGGGVCSARIWSIGYWHGKGYRLGNLPAGLARAEGPGCSSESESIKSMTIDALLWTDSRARLLRCTRVPPLSASGLQDPYLLLSYKDTQSFARQMTA